MFFVCRDVERFGIGIEAGGADARQTPVNALAYRNAPISDTLRGNATQAPEYSALRQLKKVYPSGGLPLWSTVVPGSLVAGVGRC
jgi:hypothetical protein